MVLVTVIALFAGCSTQRLSPLKAKFSIVDALPRQPDPCGPPSYPPNFNPLAYDGAALMRIPRGTYIAILDHLHLWLGSQLSFDQMQDVLRVWGTMESIRLKKTRDGYFFLAQIWSPSGPPFEAGRLTRVWGWAKNDGTVRVARTVYLDEQRTCPICLARGTMIGTPDGPVPVQDVRVGMAVWSTDRAGRRIRATVLRVGHTPVPPWHEVVRLVLADGRTVLVSPGHPISDGRLVGELRPGDHLDGTTVVSATRIPYRGGFTYDLLPSGPTGTYFAGGILLGSTLAGVQSPASAAT